MYLFAINDKMNAKSVTWPACHNEQFFRLLHCIHLVGALYTSADKPSDKVFNPNIEVNCL